MLIARISGIELRLHFSFLFLVALVVGVEVPFGARAVGAGLGWLALVFACVVVHEFAHSLLARRRGATVEAIVLLPIGGVSRLRDFPESPRDELAIAAVGPLASLGLGLLAVAVALGLGEAVWPPGLATGTFLARLAWLNFLLGGFNLLPAFPMDGGRVLRALLEVRLDRVAATKIAGTIGRIFALGMGVAGLLVNFWLILIAIFVYFGSVAEEAASELRFGLHGLRVRDAMLVTPTVVPALTPVEDVIRASMGGLQQHFPVVDGTVYAGIVGPRQLARAHAGATAISVADREAPVLSPTDRLDGEALDRLESERRPALAVLEAGRVVGLLVTDQVEALAKARLASGSA
jgi:Zn-dependent protease